MISSVFAFFGGTAFRWLVAEALQFMRQRDEHKAEMERMRLSHEIGKDQHRWQQEAIKAHAEAGLKVIVAQSQAHRDAAEDDAFVRAVEGVNQAGMRQDWIGQWNAAIRPFLATVAILLLVGNAIAPNHVILVPLVLDLIFAVLGVFVGGRIVRSRQ